MRKTLTAAVTLATAAVFTLTACGGGDNGDHPAKAAIIESPQQTQHAATVLDPPFTKPSLVLTDTHGKRFDLRAETKGRPTLIYFGYTHCPDVCPLTMSNIAIARKSLSKADQDALRVVFVTTDPERDTPAELGKWLASAGDPSFIGLTGDFTTIQAAAKTIGVGIDPPVKEKDGTVNSTHGAEVIAFSPKSDGGYLLFGDDATSAVYAKDLPKVIRGATP